MKKNIKIEKCQLFYGVLQVMHTYHEYTSSLEGHRIGIFLIDKRKKVGFNLCEDGKKYEIFRFSNSIFEFYKMRKNEGNEVINEIVPLENVLKQFKIEYKDEDINIENLSELKEKLETRYKELSAEKAKVKNEYEELSK